MKNIVVVGIGNILFQDEGVGCYAGKYLEENYDFSQPVEIIDGGTLGFKLMTYYQSADTVLIIDTVSAAGAAGAVQSFSAEALMGLGKERQTAHEVEVVEMLEICSLLDRMAEVRIVGMIPDDIQSVNIGLTQSVKAAFPALIAEVITELERAGVTVTPKGETTTLEAIINAYNEPTHAVPA